MLTYAATGHPSFEAPSRTALAFSIAYYEPDLGGVTGVLRELIAACLAKQPANRPAARDLIGRLAKAEATARPAAPAGDAGQPQGGTPTRPKKATRASPEAAAAPQGAAPSAPPRAQRTSATRPNATAPAGGSADPAQEQPTAPPRPSKPASRPERAAAQAQGQPTAGKPANARGRRGGGTISIGCDALEGQESIAMPAAIAFSPDGCLLAVTGSFSDGRPPEVRFWNAATKRADNPPASGGKAKALAHPSAALFFAPNGRFLACQPGFMAPQLWDMTARQLARLTADGESAAPARLTFSPDGRLLAAIHVNQQLRLWDAAASRPLGGPLLTSTQTVGPVFSPDSRILAFPASTGHLFLWSVENPRSPQRLSVDSPAESTRIAFSPDSSLIAIARKGENGNAKPLIYNLATSRRQGGQLGGTEFPVNLLRFSPNGTFLAAADAGYRPSSAEAALVFWDVTEARPIARTIPGMTGVAKKIAFSPDGRLLAVLEASRDAKPDASAQDQVLHLWDMIRDKPAASPVNCRTSRRAAAVEFSRDGRFLATGSGSQSVTLWYTATGHFVELPREKTGSDPVLAFSPDGTRLVTAAPGALRLWDLSSL